MVSTITTTAGTSPETSLDAGGIIARAVALGQADVLFGPGDYTVSSAYILNLKSSLRIRGSGRGITTLYFTSPKPSVARIPSPAGYPNLLSVTTGNCGLYFRAQEQAAIGVSFADLTIGGHQGVMDAAGNYQLLTIVAHSVEFDRVSFTNESVLAWDSTAGVLSPYKGASKRNFTTLDIVQLGEDRWIEPDPKVARGCSRVAFRGCTFNGEPLAETSGASGVVTAIRARKCASLVVTDFQFGDFYTPISDIISDVVFTSQPANNDTLTVNDYNPWTRKTTAVTYTFQTTPGADTATNLKVARGASKEDAAKNFASKVLGANVNSGGVYFHEALTGTEYLPGFSASTFASVRIRSLRVGIAAQPGFTLSTFAPSNAVNLSATVPAYVAAGTGSFATFRVISSGGSRFYTWRWGIECEDTIYKSINNGTVGPDTYLFSWLDDVATDVHNDFTNRWSEGGHFEVNNVVAHSVLYGNGGTDDFGFIQMRSAGFCKIGPSVCMGIMVGGGAGAKSPLGKVIAGSHTARKLVLAAGNATDGKIVTVNDGTLSVVYEFDSNGSVTGGRTAVTIGATATATIDNLRAAINTSFYGHLHKAFMEQQTAAGTARLTFVTWDKPLTGMALTSDDGNVTITSVSQPYRPHDVEWNVEAHNFGIIPAAADPFGLGGIPFLWAEGVYEHLKVGGKISLLPPLPYANCAQAVSEVLIFGDGAGAPPGAGSTITVTPKDGSGAHTFDANGALNTDVGNAHHILITAGNFDTSQKFAAEVVKRLNANMATHAYATYYTTGTVAAPNNVDVNLTITDATIGAAADLNTFVTKSGGNSATSIILNGDFASVGAAGMTLGSAGSDTATVQGFHLPIYLKDCNSWTIENLSISGQNIAQYDGGNPPAAIDHFSPSNVVNKNPEATFLGRPAQFLFVEKSAATVLSKGSIRNVHLMGHNTNSGTGATILPWGSSRTGAAKLFDLGSNVVAGDIITATGANTVNQAAV